MKITYYGHACFSAVVAGKTLLFDPFIRSNPLASAVDVEKIRADYILVTHGHGDHLEDAADIAGRSSAKVVANYEVATWLGNKGVKETIPLNHGGSLRLDFGRIKYVNAVHSSQLPDGSYGGNPGGFVVESPEGSFYASGDTALTWDMRMLADQFSLDWAALCIGDHFTMGAEDAATAATWVGAKHVLGIHYDTFPPIQIDHTQAMTVFEKAGVTLHLPAIGTEIEL